VSINQSDVFQYDNLTDPFFYSCFLGLIKKDSKKKQPSLAPKTSIGKIIPNDECIRIWERFIYASRIPAPWRNKGFHYSCFILDEDRWSSPSWIWTNAAIGRYYFRRGRISELCELADNFLQLQLSSGGWVVRYDLKGKEGMLSQTVAPNDSAYICANTLLPAFLASGDEKYLFNSTRCADWIMKFAHKDFLIHIGYELENKRWDTSANIVDIGFTVDLFIKLYQINGDSRYFEFAEKFIKIYLQTFYKGGGYFSTAIDGSGNHRGTSVFTRGHAWALEGLIPFYNLTGDPKIKEIIDDVVLFMLKLQGANGSWLHNFRPGLLQLLSGDDCKGTPVLANALLRWAGCNTDLTRSIEDAVNKAIAWCVRNTATCGTGAGGIFSWNPEGAFAGKRMTAAACIYSNCYLLEIVKDAKELSGGSINVRF
jgi:hypothetical protein